MIFSSRKEKGPGLPRTKGFQGGGADSGRGGGGGGCVTCIRRQRRSVRCVRGGCARARLFCMQDTTVLHVSGAEEKEGLPELWSAAAAAAAVYIRPAVVDAGTRGERANVLSVWKSKAYIYIVNI